MNFHKFQADHLFTGTEMLQNGFVLICNDQGFVEEITDEHTAGDDIQKYHGILAPGFVNCHCHLELSHMRGLIPEKTGLVDFVFSVMSRRHFPDEEILEAIKTAENEMLENGIVAVGDISNTLLTLGQKQKQTLRYYNFVETSGWLPEIAVQRFERSLSSQMAFSKVAPTSLVPHAPYSVSEPLWNKIKPYYESKVVSIHNQESTSEDEFFLQSTGDLIRMYGMMNLDTSFHTPSGKSSLQTYFNKLSGASHILLVHNTFTKTEDIEFVKKARPDNSVFYCLCVNANKYIEEAVPPIDLFRKNNCNIVLGTDSLASNWSLSITDEMKTIQKSFPFIAIEELLTWATSNAAKALQMDNTLGSFEKGKQPGVVLLENLDANDTTTLQFAKVSRLL